MNPVRTALFLLLIVPLVAAAETVLHNVTAYTSTTDGLQSFSALVIDNNGRIAATGDAALLVSYPNAKRIDGEGKTVLPGLIDAHAHVYGLGFLEISL